MSDLPDVPPPTRHAAARPSRRARFVLPADHTDERADERIEAFLEGPPTSARRLNRHRSRSDTLRAVRRPVPMDTRADWDQALRHEDARIARYDRPAAVMVVRVRVPLNGTEDRYVGRVGAILRELARETDRVTRASTDRFHVLLPETAYGDAEVLAERVRAACTAVLPDQPGFALEVLAASLTRGKSLQEALCEAMTRLVD